MEAASHGILGLPPNATFREPQLKQAIQRNNGTAFRAMARPGDKPNQYHVSLHPATPGTARQYNPRPNETRPDRRPTAYYEPELADLETIDAGDEYLERVYARAKSHLQKEVTGLPDQDVVYRGMSAEEYQQILDTGQIESVGDYNIGDEQKGLTYFTTEVRSAESYANGFAPLQWKPTIGYPCYIIAIKRPPEKRIRKVKGTGEHEVGVIGSVPSSDIVAVWRGRVFDHVAEPYDFREVDYYDHLDRAVGADDTHRVRYGGYSAQVVWERIL